MGWRDFFSIRTFPLKKTFVRELLWGSPISVRHSLPDSLTIDGKERWGAREQDFECFDLFDDFAEFANQHDGPFRIQQLLDTKISGSFASEAPAYGRRYEIFYNQVNVGLLQIIAHAFDFKRNKKVRVNVVLDRVPPRILPFYEVFGFLKTVAGLVTSLEIDENTSETKSEFESALTLIRQSMLAAIWQIEDDEFGVNLGPDLEIDFVGVPEYYLHIIGGDQE